MKKKKVETKRNKRQCPQTNTSIVLGGLILVISLTLYTCTSSKTLKNQFYRESSCETMQSAVSVQQFCRFTCLSVWHPTTLYV